MALLSWARETVASSRKRGSKAPLEQLADRFVEVPNIESGATRRQTALSKGRSVFKAAVAESPVAAQGAGTDRHDLADPVVQSDQAHGADHHGRTEEARSIPAILDEKKEPRVSARLGLPAVLPMPPRLADVRGAVLSPDRSGRGMPLPGE